MTPASAPIKQISPEVMKQAFNWLAGGKTYLEVPLIAWPVP
jgi:hypothetical protein